MKTMGLIGGISWESTASYYKLLNRGVNAALGKNHSAKIKIHSFDFEEIEKKQFSGNWDSLESDILSAGRSLQAAGADFLMVCANTMHKVADRVESETGLPLLHIVDCVGQALVRDNRRVAGLLGTVFTMSEPFYRSRLEGDFPVKVLVPSVEEMETINRIIYGELVKGQVRAESREEFFAIMDRLRDAGADSIILGCTEIGMLIEEYSLPLYDTLQIHVDAAVAYSLGR